MYLQYLRFSTINYTKYVFNWTSTSSAQLKCIKYKISCSNLADFKYTSYTKSKIAGHFIKYINMNIYL